MLIEEAKNGDIKNITKPSLREGIEILFQDEFLNLNNKDQDNSKQKDNNNINNINNNKEDNNNNENKNWVNRMIEKLEPDIENPNSETPSKGKQFLNNMMDAFNDVKERTKDIDFKGKFKKAGEFVQDKTEKIQNSGAFNRFMNAVSNSIDNVIQTTDKYFFKNDNSKIIPMNPTYINPTLIPQNNNINNNNNVINLNQNNLPPFVIKTNPNPNLDPNNINNDIKLKINKIEQDNKLNSPPNKQENNDKNNININMPSNYKEIKSTNDNKIKIENIENDKKKEEKLDEEEKKKEDVEKLDDNDNENEDDPSQIIMSNIPVHN